MAGRKGTRSPAQACTINQFTQHGTAEDDKNLGFLKIGDNGSFIITVLCTTMCGVSDVAALCDSWELFLF